MTQRSPASAILHTALPALGTAELLVGLVAAWYGPYELRVFSLFAEAGPFHYEGFGPHSLWFGFLFVQTAAYYLIAALLLPLAIGTLRRAAWARRLTLGYAVAWLILGLWLLWLAAMLGPSMHAVFPALELTPARAGALWAVGALILAVAPALLALAVASKAGVAAFLNGAAPLPASVAAAAVMLALGLLALHAFIVTGAPFAFFGVIIEGRAAAQIMAGIAVAVGGLIAGLLLRRTWAWRGGVAFLAVGALSLATSLALADVSDVILSMGLPDVERDFVMRFGGELDTIGFKAWLVAPIAAALLIMLRAGRHFGAANHPRA